MSERPRRPLPVFHRVAVTEIDDLTPHLRRISFEGESLKGYQNDGPSTHCKLLVAPEGEELALPAPGPDGLQWPEDRQRPISRTYTPRRVDTRTGRLDIEFALHPNAGPATAWATQARPGDVVAVTGGRGAYRIDPAAPWTLLVADESALPAAATVLEDAPAGARILLIAEIPDPDDAIAIETDANLTATWVRANDAEPGRAAYRALAELTVPPGEGRFWICLEASAMRVVRRYLLDDRGVATTDLYTRGYWKIGAANHPDHDTGEDR